MNLKNHNNLLILAKKLVIIQLLIAVFASILLPSGPVLAQEPLTISNIEVVQNDKTATISWRTNRAAYGKIQWGITTNNYKWSLQSGKKDVVQSMTITGLFSETNYYFRITAWDDTTEVTSFEQTFQTKKLSDNKAPTISNVTVAYLTGRTATIQWETDEPATTEVEYGLTSGPYNQNKGDGALKRIHDITLTGLLDGSHYHFRVKSKDKDNNVTTWYDMTFQTKLTEKTDKDALIIYDIKPAAENDVSITQTTAVISWRTNKLAEGWVRYGTTSNLGTTVSTNPPRDFTHTITLAGLTAGRTYYFEIQVRDVLGKEIKTEKYTFTTKSTPQYQTTNQPGTIGSGSVLGATACNIDFKTDLGFFGAYYNLPEGHPDVGLPLGGWSKVGRENDWYSSQYFSMNRVDGNLVFGTNFFPLNEGKPGDPNYFAVNWRAIISVPQDGYYNYEISSDDDSWLFIDDELTSNLNGIHPAKPETRQVYLTAGYHKLEIFYADRAKRNAWFEFKPDNRLKFHPLPTSCEIEDVLDYNNSGVGGGATTSTGSTGQVLGVKTTSGATTTSVSPYVCNPNLGYTKFKALYKTADSPDIWAILETGQKHYITSPEAFNKYQCDWSKVKTVSKSYLNSFPNANLVRTPQDPTVYHLFQRADVKWLKINIPSPTVFVSYPNNYWGNVARIDILDIQSYPDVKLISVKNDPKVYLIENGKRRWIPTAAVFEKYNYEWAEVVELNQIHLDYYEEGATLN
ncbi:MAG: hypothetical protein HUU49_04250 [Candidatus Buchananbacteria bacterium]|nr:hypothetical protein [Candidatus Buchananbacteria bacterium]